MRKSASLRNANQTSMLLLTFRERPTYLVDSDSRTFCYRTSHLAWMQDEALPFYEAVNELLGSDLSSKELKRKSAGGERGPHFPCIMGHHRQYCYVGANFLLPLTF